MFSKIAVIVAAVAGYGLHQTEPVQSIQTSLRALLHTSICHYSTVEPQPGADYTSDGLWTDISTQTVIAYSISEDGLVYSTLWASHNCPEY